MKRQFLSLNSFDRNGPALKLLSVIYELGIRCITFAHQSPGNENAYQMKHFFEISFLLIVIFSMFQSCSYHNIEDIDPGNGANECDTSRVISYSADIVPIMNNSCGANNTCHMSGSSDSNIPLGDIRTLRALSSDGSLMGSINHNSGYEPMPEAGSKLPVCSIHVIQTWINQGTLNN